MLRIKARDEFAVKQEIKTAKKKWNATLGAKERDQRYQKIQKYKLERDSLIQNIYNINQQIKNLS